MSHCRGVCYNSASRGDYVPGTPFYAELHRSILTDVHPFNFSLSFSALLAAMKTLAAMRWRNALPRVFCRALMPKFG